MTSDTLPVEVILALDAYNKHADFTHAPETTNPFELMQRQIANISDEIRDEFPTQSQNLDEIQPILIALANTVK